MLLKPFLTVKSRWIMINKEVKIRIVLYHLCSVLLFVNIGCTPYWRSDQFSVGIFPKGHKGSGGVKEVNLGMSREEVFSALGKPDTKRIFNSKDNKEVWIYSRLMGGGSKVTLTFLNGILEKIDEFLWEGLF